VIALGLKGMKSLYTFRGTWIAFVSVQLQDIVVIQLHTLIAKFVYDIVDQLVLIRSSICIVA